jgi:lysophospholipase L1-like esterase
MIRRLMRHICRTIHGAVNGKHRKSWPVWMLLVGSLVLYVVHNRVVVDPFDQPFCDPGDGTCHERPDRPSPRTVYSAWNKQQYDRWWDFYHVLNQRAVDYATKRAGLLLQQQQQKIPRAVILLGDSITESWVGTGAGIPNERTKGVPQVLHDELIVQGNLDPLVLAISGDQTQHLLYRLQNGHLQSAYTSDDPSAVFVIMIGTNNLGSGELPGPTSDGVLAVVEYVLQRTDASQNRVMVFQVLPRGDGKTWLPKLCPPRCQQNTGQPFTSFLPPINSVNQAVRDGVARLNAEYTTAASGGSSSSPPSRVAVVDCGSEFLNTDGDSEWEVKPELMPDLLHPNAEGHKILARCILDFLQTAVVD